MLTLTSLAGARACLRDSVLYARTRNAFGQPISNFGIVRDMLNEMHRRIVLAESIAHHALDLLCAGKSCKAEISAAKRVICDQAVWCADRAIQIHGGYGYTSEFKPERWWRDLRLMPIGGGTSEIMAEIIAKELGWQ